jgi:hypothetical protein
MCEDTETGAMTKSMSKRYRASVSARKFLLEDDHRSSAHSNASHRAFFKSICLPNGTHKTTAPGRLRDVDEVIVSMLPPRQSVHFLDVGISSGVTTLEFIERLEAHGHQTTGVGVDIRVHAFLRRWLGVDVLFDPKGNVLQLAVPGLAKGRPNLPVNTFKGRVLQTAIVLAEGLFARRWAQRPRADESVLLISPRLRQRPGFDIFEHDITTPWPDQLTNFDFIRAANILNLSYFEPRVLHSIVNALVPKLKSHGLLLICRTSEEDGINHGTIFQRRGNSICVVRRIGNGSEAESILSHCPDPVAPDEAGMVQPICAVA